MQRLILGCLFLLGVFSCTTPEKQGVQHSKAQQIINSAIKAHGGEKYDHATYEFDFRKKHYSFNQADGKYEYRLSQSKNGVQINATLSNAGYSQTNNGTMVEMSEADQRRYGDALNSVIYFAQLPYRLNDPAVKKSYYEKATIKGKTYDAIKVSFNEENGGTDHDDLFMYWINTETKTMDYLAYSYRVNGGGVRFRNAYNPRTVGGIRFQDYENYKAPVGTDLSTLPQLFESGSLKLLSKIELENVKEGR